MFSATIEPLEAKRLVAIGSRIDSDHDGEALNAVRMLGKLLAGHGLNVGQVIARGLEPVRLPPPPRPRWTATPPAYDATLAHQLKASQCLRCGGRFNAKEVDFLREMRVVRRPSPKQREWLDRLHARIVEDF